MKRWIGTAVLALTLMLGASAAICPAAAAPAQTVAQKSQAGQATDFSAHRYYRRYGYRPYYRPYYYARPYYYRPYPYYAPYYAPYYVPAPVPFGFGFGFGPWGW
jgi:hypothetical protein